MELHIGWGPLHVCQSGHKVQGVGHVGDVRAGTTAPAVLPCQGGTGVVILVGTSDVEVRRRLILQTSAIREKILKFLDTFIQNCTANTKRLFPSILLITECLWWESWIFLPPCWIASGTDKPRA
jgi:hypothetical protein